MRGLKQKSVSILIALGVLTGGVPFAQAQTDVYLLAGQSNMVGWSDNSSLPTDLQQLRPDIQTYWQDLWQDLQPGLGGNSSKFGPEITFGRNMADTLPSDSNIALVKYAVSGTSLWNDWQPTEGVEYINFMDAIDEALFSIDNPIIVGMLWMQGESDAYPPHSTLSYAEAYEQNLTDFIQSVRFDLGLPDMPFVIGQISEAPVWTWGDIVRQAQLNVSQMVPNTTLVITSDLGISADGMHYDADGTITLGSRFADAMQDLKFPASKASSSTDGTTLSWSHPIGSSDNRILVVGIAGEDDSTDDLVISSVTYNGVNMHLIEASSQSIYPPPVHMKTELYYLLDSNLPSGGSHTVDVTYSGNVSKRCAGAITLKDREQQPPEAVVTNSNEDANTISTDITTQTNGAWAVDIVGCINQGSFTADSNQQVERFDISSDSSTAAGSLKPISSTGSSTISWSFSDFNSTIVHSVVAFASRKHTISGYVLEPNDAPIEDVLMVPDSGGETGTTDPNGYYEVVVTYNWSGTVTPTKPEYKFGPSQETYSNITADWSEQDYEGRDINIYDLDNNYSIDWGDVEVICEHWLEVGPDVPGDLYRDDDNIVNFLDLADFAAVW